MTRQRRYHAKRHAAGQCRRCPLQTTLNRNTGRPFWYCWQCRMRRAEHYARTGKQL